ncbi:hypothetical protein [Okeania sp. SIO2B3]|uniref:hypothetical protein n=1 Tax=Okeania sp. SIO2B3 TaxID=2607784 RepID=UPI0013C187CA|nr:hypothetical protein [Okeania sp. SIO2B3]NET45491.1 hypothetical protein [Okeania sp. SIO2B3]
MGTRTIDLGNGAELTIDEPNSLSSSERPLLVTSAIVQAISDSASLTPSTRSGFLPITIGYEVFRIYYQFRVRRVMNALTVYSEAINHIQKNPHLYDRRLATKAIQVLHECCKENF